ncbi:MAG: 6,7-dimethyl-8-ribityllumazine synthase [Methylibium sp.]|nr:6,7-dimethyl-8-ribityllumazine synthase [Methylibium sp.]MBA3623836.1 6,7-dimethyl-8-ribityllumazine synthase [Methylibium sp.]
MQGTDPGNTIFGDTIAELEGESLRIGIVQARFNAAITDRLAGACLAELEGLGVAQKHIEHVSVPGALEVPIALQAMARRNQFDALIALGCVVRGETYHFELVSNESAAGVSRVSLDHRTPVVNGILTVETEDQAWARADEKGRDAARVAVEMANLLEELS